MIHDTNGYVSLKKVKQISQNIFLGLHGGWVGGGVFYIKIKKTTL